MKQFVLKGNIYLTPDSIKKIDQLVEHLDKGKDTKIVIRNNTGGDTKAALLIWDKIESCTGKVHLELDGYAMSAAAYITMACYCWQKADGQDVKVNINKNNSVVFHRPRFSQVRLPNGKPLFASAVPRIADPYQRAKFMHIVDETNEFDLLFKDVMTECGLDPNSNFAYNQDYDAVFILPYGVH